MIAFDPQTQIPAAMRDIAPFIRHTLLHYSLAYSQLSGAAVYFKCENLQHTGSFKVRGALNKILSISAAGNGVGVVAASTGNHGAACAYALGQVGGRGIVFVPETAVATKLDAIRRLGAEIRTVGQDSVEAENYARTFAAEQGLTFVSPYNDPYVIAGQGTIAVELLQDLPDLDAVFVSVGGGGLIGGISSYLKRSRPKTVVVGCSPENSQVMARSVQAGQILDLPSLPTLSDGTAGGVEQGAITFPLCRDFVDRYVSISEEEIAVALRQFIDTEHQLIEGSAAVAIAGFLKLAPLFQGKKVAIILCGANISLENLAQVLAGKGKM